MATIDDTVIPVTDDAGNLVQARWLAAAQPVHRQLRPALPEDYVNVLQEIFQHGGRMVVAVRDDRVIALAIWRLILNTAHRREMYIDDLVTDAAMRSTGAGATLLEWCTRKAVSLRCAWLTLDSGTQRTDAHRFYFRERMHVSSFHFVKALPPASA